MPPRLNLGPPLDSPPPAVPVAIPLSPASQQASAVVACLPAAAAPGFRALPRSTGAIASNARHLTLLLTTGPYPTLPVSSLPALSSHYYYYYYHHY